MSPAYVIFPPRRTWVRDGQCCISRTQASESATERISGLSARFWSSLLRLVLPGRTRRRDLPERCFKRGLVLVAFEFAGYGLETLDLRQPVQRVGLLGLGVRVRGRAVWHTSSYSGPWDSGSGSSTGSGMSSGASYLIWSCRSSVGNGNCAVVIGF